MSLIFITLILSVCVSNTLQSIPVQEIGTKSDTNKENISHESQAKNEQGPILNVYPPTKNVIAKPANSSKHDQNDTDKSNSHITSIEPGADLRLVSVISLIVLSCLFCICCRIYR